MSERHSSAPPLTCGPAGEVPLETRETTLCRVFHLDTFETGGFEPGLIFRDILHEVRGRHLPEISDRFEDCQR